jgi:nicotinamidase-related amidase
VRTINGIEVWDTPEELLGTAHTAALVIDMQNETASLDGGYAANGYDLDGVRSTIPAIQGVLESSRSLGLLIGFTEFVHRDRRGVTLVDGPSVFMHQGESWVSDVADGTWEAETLPELAPAPREIVIQKSRGSALQGTRLDHLLRQHAVRTVVLMGCVTDGCVLKTAVHMAESGYYPVIVRDGVGALTPEKHDLGLRYLQLKFPVFTAEEIRRVWAG